ncbi:peroxiredoxin-4 [Phytophthora cinnamomi]|uniref:peroxiredoxin-4 n=1 Tax=Phytophthora cinnamomi TaxID=4785 RepID=UPI00355A0F6E|nr:peroxiredoxin-4 [Phytophthora cinnamomi]
MLWWTTSEPRVCVTFRELKLLMHSGGHYIPTNKEPKDTFRAFFKELQEADEKTLSAGAKQAESRRVPHVSEALLEQLGYQKNRYSASAAEVTPRKPTPDFSNVNAVVNEVRERCRSATTREQWLILFFYVRLHVRVPHGDRELQRQRGPVPPGINAEVVAISTDSHHTHLAWVKTPRNWGGLGKDEHPLIADISES